MKSWVRWVCDGVAATFRRPAHLRRREGRLRRLAILEGLEGRAVLSPLPFATLPGQITAPNQPVAVTLHIQPGQLSSSRSKPVYLGFDVVPAAGSTVTPHILGVFGPHGAKSAATGTQGGAFITRVAPPRATASDFTVDVVGLNGQSGGFVVNAFLPGDVDGDGIVDQADLSLIHLAYGSREGQLRYNPAADFNLDGRVACTDLTFARQNFGAQVFIPNANPTPTLTSTPTAVSTPTSAQPLLLAPVPAGQAAPQGPLYLLTPVSGQSAGAGSTPALLTSAPARPSAR